MVGYKVYKCIPCEYVSKNKTNYTKHTKTQKHYILTLTCPRCKTKYKRPNMYNNHIATCVYEPAAVAPAPIAPQVINNNTTNNNNNSTTNNTTNNTQNIYNITLNSLSGAEYKYMSRLIQDSTLALNHETNLLIYRDSIESRIRLALEPISDIGDIVLTKEESDILCDYDHPLNREMQNKWKPIAKKINSLEKNGIQILPLVKPSDPITLKIWFNPSLLTDEDHESLDVNKTYFVEDYPKLNRATIDRFLSLVITEAIVDTYINENRPRSSCLFSELSSDMHPDDDLSKDMFYKDLYSDRMVLKKLTKEVMMSMIDDESLNNLLFSNLNKYHIEHKKLDFEYYLVRNAIANALDGLLTKKYANTRAKKNTA